MKSNYNIRVRDPYVLVDKTAGCYYLYSSVYEPGQIGFDVYKGSDLEHWEGPFPVFRPAPNFWSDRDFWAPEVHRYRGRYYMFASFKAARRYRGTQILVAGSPEGPFTPLTSNPVTPAHWECLDGTLYIEEDGTPYMVFCHEWTQIHNGAICAMKLTKDLTKAVGRPVYLFSAADAPWVKCTQDPSCIFPTYVTDGPWLHRCRDGKLLMLWSSFGINGYSIGMAESDNGRIDGNWLHYPVPLFDRDGGHCMIFRDLQGQLKLTLHAPNTLGLERPCFYSITEDKGFTIRVASNNNVNKSSQGQRREIAKTTI